MSKYSAAQHSLFRSVYWLLRSLTAVFVKCGLGYREFGEAAKLAMVDSVLERYKKGSKTTSVTRCQVLTGLTRKEIGRLRRTSYEEALYELESPNPIVDVVSEWKTNDVFLTRQGEPRTLPIEGEEASFETLIRSVSRDISPTTTLKEMLRIGVIKRVGNRVAFTGRLSEPDEQRVEQLADVMKEVARGFSGAWMRVIDEETMGFRMNYKTIEIRSEHEELWRPLLDNAIAATPEALESHRKAYRELYGDVKDSDQVDRGLQSYSIGAFCYQLD